MSLRESFGPADLFEGRTQSGEDIITNSYFDGQRKRLKGFKELRSLMDDYQALFGDNFLAEVERGAKTTRDISDSDYNLINSAANNIFVPFEFRETDFTKFGSQAPMNLQNLYKIYDAFNGTRIK